MIRPRAASLKLRLGIGAALLGAGTILTAAILYSGMTRVADRLETALAAETRMARYAALSRQVSTLLVVATETVQTGQSAEARAERIDPVAEQIRETFGYLHRDLELAVDRVRGMGIDQQSRYGTQSIGLARMEALLENTVGALTSLDSDRDRLRTYTDSFASGFDPLLSQAVNTEIIFRNETLAGIADLRRSLTLTALVIAVLSVVLVLAFYLGLIRPQFGRLDRLRQAARQIGQEDFAVALPATRDDEIGRLYAETNRMAAALSARQETIRQDRARLNEIIAERTEALRAANTVLEQVDEDRRRFFADISHELRTPLTVILLEAQIGRRGPEATRDSFATIEARAERLNRRIDDLLRVARSDSGQLALDTGRAHLPDLVGEVVEEVRAEIENAGMRLERGAIPEIAVICDANWMRQVLAGLVRNCIRHARDGGVIRLAAETGEGQAGISVTDLGPGIAAGDQARIFDRFAQAGPANAQGFGVGLALARWVVEEQGGRIRLVSPLPPQDPLGPASGTKIAVLLPRSAS